MPGVYLYIETYKGKFEDFIVMSTQWPSVCDGYEFTNSIANLPIKYEKGKEILLKLLNEGDFDHVNVWLDDQRFNVGECRKKKNDSTE